MSHWARLFREVIEHEDQEISSARVSICEDCSATELTHCTDYDRFLCAEHERKAENMTKGDTQ